MRSGRHTRAVDRTWVVGGWVGVEKGGEGYNGRLAHKLWTVRAGSEQRQFSKLNYW